MKAKSKPIAVILIRSGSRGLVDKNIKPLAGKPLVFYTIEVALASKLFSEIWVSSDSLTYLELCRQAYPEIRCVHRPKELALSTTSSLETLRDFLQPFEEEQVFVNLQVTSPLREVEHLIESYQLYCQSGADHLISCVKADKSRSLFLQFAESSFIRPLRYLSTMLGRKSLSITIPMVVSGFLARTFTYEMRPFTRIKQ